MLKIKNAAVTFCQQVSPRPQPFGWASVPRLSLIVLYYICRRAYAEGVFMERLFIIDGSCGGWTDSCRSVVRVELSGSYVSLSVKSGRNPMLSELPAVLGLLLKEYEKENGSLMEYERKRDYRFCYVRGFSGCADYYIETRSGDGFPERKHLLAKSCFDKVGRVSGFVYDFLDLAISAGCAFEKRDGHYFFDRSKDEFLANGGTITCIKPRLYEYEEGWTCPRDIAPIVPLLVCRKAPLMEELDEPEPEKTESEETDEE